MIPVALFAYARPDHLRKTLACLRANRVPLIYAFSDAAKTPQLNGRVDEVRQLLHDITWCDVVVTERDVNLGLGRSIRSGVAEVLKRHESLIVFEDDLICVDGTYRYLSAALDRYRDDAAVMSVTGWTHPRITPAGLNGQPYFDGRAECWVWGAWRRSWDGMEKSALTLMHECEQRGIDPFLYGADLVDMAAAEEEKNIWAVRFLYLHMLRGGLCVRPPHSLVEHIGFDAAATNAVDGQLWANPPLGACPAIPERWPDPVEHPECRSTAQQVYGGRPQPPTFRERLRTTARRATSVLARRLYRLARRRTARRPEPIGRDYEVLSEAPVDHSLNGWQTPAVAERQHAAFASLLTDAGQGKPRRDFVALAEAIQATQLLDPLILEVGCASGWNADVLALLLGRSVRYVGADYSQAMTALGRRCYPQRAFVTGDAVVLPFKDRSCDVVVAGTSLMHIADYTAAIAESGRVARRWCIFHTVPVLQRRQTTILSKNGYGAPMLEVVFNERDLRATFERHGLRIHSVFDSIPYDLAAVIGEHTTTKTFLCEVAAS